MCLLRATVVIATRNRREELRRALASVLSQSMDVDVLVMDDGSEDGTAEMVEADFPSVRLERSEANLGPTTQRNRAGRLVQTPVIVLLDDDAAFACPDTIAQSLREFDDPRVGAVAIPFTDVSRGKALRQMAPANDDIYVADAYVGAACALRRDVFLECGGYRERLFMHGEEGDLCVRMLQAGYVTRLGRADPALHFESARRDSRQRDALAARNNVLYAWYNVPMPYLPAHLLGTSIKSIRSSFRSDHRHLELAVRGLIDGYLTCLRQVTMRQPVTREVYRISRILRRRGPLRLRDLEPLLPQRRSGSQPS